MRLVGTWWGADGGRPHFNIEPTAWESRELFAFDPATCQDRRQGQVVAAPEVPLSHARRGWFQFSLRSVLIQWAIAAVLFNWLALHIRAARRQQAAVAAISAAGGIAIYDFEWDPWGDHAPKFLRQALGHDFFQDVVYVRLNTPAANDELMARIRYLDGLGALVLNGTPVTDAGLAHLKSLKGLGVIELAGTRVTTGGIRELRTALPKVAVYR